MGAARSVLVGAEAGAAGTTALNLITYLDMTLRGRGASSTPGDTVEKLTVLLRVDVPGAGDTRDHRVSALGALTGIASGIGIGAALGLARGWAGAQAQQRAASPPPWEHCLAPTPP